MSAGPPAKVFRYGITLGGEAVRSTAHRLGKMCR
jgi:hypothetical protein